MRRRRPRAGDGHPYDDGRGSPLGGYRGLRAARRKYVCRGRRENLTVTAGSAIAFFTDVNSTHKFSLVDFTGLAVSDGFAGQVTGDIHGPVLTAVSGNGTSPTFVPGRRSRIDCRVNGNGTLGR